MYFIICPFCYKTTVRDLKAITWGPVLKKAFKKRKLGRRNTPGVFNSHYVFVFWGFFWGNASCTWHFKYCKEGIHKNRHNEMNLLLIELSLDMTDFGFNVVYMWFIYLFLLLVSAFKFTVCDLKPHPLPKSGCDGEICITFSPRTEVQQTNRLK